VKKAVLFLNGDYSDEGKPDIEENTLVIAVDGGLSFLLQNHITPDLFIGDADSAASSDIDRLRQTSCEVLIFSQSKDEIDAELAIEEAKRRGFNFISIRGWRGDRIDMILALLYIMGSHDDENTQIVAVSSGLEMGIVASHKRLESIPGEKWSVLPLFGDADGVTLKGFRYEIDNRRMMPSKPYGISNVAKSSPVSISVSQGKVVYFRWKKKPS